ncbi:MAG: hypothetical protein GY953_42700, partial [bacterium]|nr:hypothetical protein [bacterium]
KPSKMRGVESQAMVLAAFDKSDASKTELVVPPEGSKAGDRIFVKGFEGEADEQLNPRKKVFEQIQPNFGTNDSCVATYEGVMRRLTEAAREETDLMIRAKCAPHFKRMAWELDSDWPITTAHGYEAGGCLAGTRYCRVTPMGGVTACPYMEAEDGSVREQDFATIWQDA